MKTTPKFDCRRQSDLSKLLCVLILGAAAVVLARWVDLPLPFLVGGLLSTIGLTALSLEISPVKALTHHVFRTFGTVFIAVCTTNPASYSLP